MNALAKFLFEMGHLKRVPRSGWSLVGIDRPESVAEHSFRTAVVGYILAHIEGADVLKTTLMCLFHDAHEGRIGDLHHLGQVYAEWPAAQERAQAGLLDRLPPPLAEQLGAALGDREAADSREGRVARDADRLELMLQAIEYRSLGCVALEDWISQVRSKLETEAARQLADACLNDAARVWWSDLMPRDEAPQAPRSGAATERIS